MTIENFNHNILNRCMKQLIAVGAEFAITIAGQKYGTLEIAEAEIKPKRTRNANRWSAVSAEIRGRLSRMQPCDVEVFRMPKGESIADFQAHVSYQAAKLFGKGERFYNTIQTTDKNGIAVFRTA